MKKAKILCLLMAAVLILSVLAACTPVETPGENPDPPSPQQTTSPSPSPNPSPESPNPSDPPPPPPDPVTLTWAVWDIEMVAYYEPLIARYKEIAPHITIEMVDLGTTDWNSIVQTQLLGGVDYDLIKVRDVPGYVDHVNANLLLPLNDMLAPRGVDIGDYMGLPEQFMMNGNLYALPFRSDFWVTFYNKDIFDAAGVPYPTNNMTFAQWTDIIKAVTSGSGTDKIWGNHFHNWRSTTTLFGVLDGVHTVNDGNYDFLIPFYEAVLELEDGDFVPRRTDLVAGGVHHRQTWAPQQIAMVNMGTWFTADSLQSEFNWGIAGYPAPTAATIGNTLGQVTQLAIPRNAKHPEEAMDFIAFVAGPEGAKICASVGQIPALMTDDVIDAILSIPGFPQDDTTRGALRPKNIFLEQPPHVKAGEINAILNEAHTEIMDRTMTIREGIDMMNSRVSQLLG